MRRLTAVKAKQTRSGQGLFVAQNQVENDLKDHHIAYSCELDAFGGRRVNEAAGYKTPPSTPWGCLSVCILRTWSARYALVN